VLFAEAEARELRQRSTDSRAFVCHSSLHDFHVLGHLLRPGRAVKVDLKKLVDRSPLDDLRLGRKPLDLRRGHNDREQTQLFEATAPSGGEMSPQLLNRER
jgi:hypothetical protein